MVGNRGQPRAGLLGKLRLRGLIPLPRVPCGSPMGEMVRLGQSGVTFSEDGTILQPPPRYPPRKPLPKDHLGPKLHLGLKQAKKTVGI